MIITLAEAQEINPDIDQRYLDGLEASIRQLTHNKFLNKAMSYRGLGVTSDAVIKLSTDTTYLRVGDTVQVSYTGVNDGLYVVKSVDKGNVTLDTDKLFTGKFSAGTLTKVEYPADVINGFKGLIKYDFDMADKTGIKSETIGRMSTTYYDANSNENINGYPSALMDFIKKYRKIGW